MKKNIFLSVIAAVLSVVSFTSCDDISDDGYTVVRPGELNLAASLSQKEFDYMSSEGTVQIKANTKWTVSTDATWITFDATSGAGNSELGFKVSANPNTSARNATITITSTETGVKPQVLDVSQGYTNLVLNKHSLFFEQKGGEQTIEITSSSDWTAYYDSDNLSVTPDKGGSGANSTVTISCKPNNTISTRTFTVLFENREDNGTVNQAELSIVQESSSFSLNVTSCSVGAINGSSSFVIKSDGAWTISVAEGASWCHVSPSSGEGNADVIISASDNDYASERTAVINVIASDNNDTRSLVVTQAAAPVDVRTTVVEVIYHDHITVTVGYWTNSDVRIVDRGVTCRSVYGSWSTTVRDVVSDYYGRFSVDVPSLEPATEYEAYGFVTIDYNGIIKTYSGPVTTFTTKSNPTSSDNPNPSNP